MIFDLKQDGFIEYLKFIEALRKKKIIINEEEIAVLKKGYIDINGKTINYKKFLKDVGNVELDLQNTKSNFIFYMMITKSILSKN